MDPRNEKIGILLVDQQTGFLGAATEFLEREDDLTVLEVWPESHWPGFALREVDVFKTYMAWWCM